MAFRTGGSSVERFATFESLTDHVAPGIGSPKLLASESWTEPPTRMNADAGAIEIAVAGAVGFPVNRNLSGMLKGTKLLLTPFTLTPSGPEVVPVGTVATIEESLQLPTEAGIPLNVTRPLSCEAPKPAPDIVMESPYTPVEELRPEIEGVAGTVNCRGLLWFAPTKTITGPVDGTERHCGNDGIRRY
jgi:hypothetical protein